MPSARFRVRQYIAKLRAHEIGVNECPARFGSYPPANALSRLFWLPFALADRMVATVESRHADLVLFQREMISTYFSAERLCKAPAVLDVDDAIWINQRWRGIDRLASQCRLILCGNTYIADYFRHLAPVRLLATGVDTDVWKPGEPGSRPTMVWSGSSAGLPYLLSIESALERVLATLPQAMLRVVCDRVPRFDRLPRQRIDFVPWSERREVEAVQTASVGLMPMPDTQWSRGKCGFKLLTYLACGLPAVASPYGMNREVIGGGGAFAAETVDDWTELLLMLLRDPAQARFCGVAGRANVESSYSTVQLAPVLAAALRDAAA